MFLEYQPGIKFFTAKKNVFFCISKAPHVTVFSEVGIPKRAFKGLRPWPTLVNPKCAYFGRKFLIGRLMFRREKPFADERATFR